jgi:hypothetical protein
MLTLADRGERGQAGKEEQTRGRQNGSARLMEGTNPCL